MSKSVDLRSAAVSVRSFTLTRSLIKQGKLLRSLPKAFLRERKEGEESNDVNEKCIGYVMGSALGWDEYTSYLIFIHLDDLYVYGWSGYKGVAKRLYV